jgi:hypothetical protein
MNAISNLQVSGEIGGNLFLDIFTSAPPKRMLKEYDVGRHILLYAMST